MRYDVVVIGAGAAGLMCAIEAGKRGRRVLVIETQGRAGKKILISGGGRCNFTNLGSSPENYLSNNPHFARSALARYTAADFIAIVEKHGIAYHEKKLGQLFCDGSARAIVDLLLTECDSNSVTVMLNCCVSDVSYDEGFRLASNKGAFEADSLVIASGGLSIPKMGATDFGYRVARSSASRSLLRRAGLVAANVRARRTRLLRRPQRRFG